MSGRALRCAVLFIPAEDWPRRKYRIGVGMSMNCRNGTLVSLASDSLQPRSSKAPPYPRSSFLGGSQERAFIKRRISNHHVV
eukprot:scaffold12330_cov83-Skeletonema_marinoi.AAC.32